MSLFRRDVEELEAYTLREPSCAVKVNQNESPWDWPDALKGEALRAASELAFHRYPSFGEGALASALERRLGLARGSVLVGNGSNELLQALCLAALGPGRRALIPSPSFSLYRHLALLASAEARIVPMDGGIFYDAEMWLEAVRSLEPGLVILCSPNNPTGACFPREALEELLEAAPGLVAVDEAYGEFSGLSARPLLPEHENLVVLRTFSKAWGCAALRLGYLMAAPETAAQVRKALLPYNVSPLTAGLGIVALENAPLFEARARETVRQREALSCALSGIPGLTVYPSEANFILVRAACTSARAVHSALKSRGVLVRDVSAQPGLQGCLRVSVGTEEENRAVVCALEELCGKSPSLGGADAFVRARDGRTGVSAPQENAGRGGGR